MNNGKLEMKDGIQKRTQVSNIEKLSLVNDYLNMCTLQILSILLTIMFAILVTFHYKNIPALFYYFIFHMLILKASLPFIFNKARDFLLYRQRFILSIIVNCTLHLLITNLH